MYSISALARTMSLSRSTLLYYDSIGLLRASRRTRSNYRQYSEADRERLATICRYRSLGLSLEEVAAVLDQRGRPSRGAAAILERRLVALEGEIARMRDQERVLLSMLQA